MAVCVNPMSSTAPVAGGGPAGALMGALRGSARRRLEHEVRKLEADGVEVLTIEPSSEDLAVMGTNFMSRKRRSEVSEQAHRSVARDLRRRRAGAAGALGGGVARAGGDPLRRRPDRQSPARCWGGAEKARISPLNGGPRSRTSRCGFGDRRVTDTPVPRGTENCSQPARRARTGRSSSAPRTRASRAAGTPQAPRRPRRARGPRSPPLVEVVSGQVAAMVLAEVVQVVVEPSSSPRERRDRRSPDRRSPWRDATSCPPCTRRSDDVADLRRWGARRRGRRGDRRRTGLGRAAAAEPLACGASVVIAGAARRCSPRPRAESARDAPGWPATCASRPTPSGSSTPASFSAPLAASTRSSTTPAASTSCGRGDRAEGRRAATRLNVAVLARCERRVRARHRRPRAAAWSSTSRSPRTTAWPA